MANYSSKDVGFILIDGYNVLGSVTTVQDAVEAFIAEVTALGDQWQRFAKLGISKGALQQSGFYDDAVGQVNQALVDTNVGATRVFCYNVEGNVIGKHFVGYSGAVEAKYERVAAIEKFHVANATYSPSGPIEEGQILHALGTESAASGDTKASSVDNSLDPLLTVIPITNISIANPTVVTTAVPHGLVTGDKIVVAGSNSTPTINGQQSVTVTDATHFTVPVNVTVSGNAGTFVRANSDNGGSAYLEVTALTLGGGTNWAPLVLHSVDNAVWATLATFTAVTVAPSAQRVVVAAGTTVNRYLAMSWTYGGSPAGESVTFFVGFARA